MTLMTRDLTPEDYELLLHLDESVAKKNVLSEKDASALLETTLEANTECTVCMCDMEIGVDIARAAHASWFGVRTQCPVSVSSRPCRVRAQKASPSLDAADGSSWCASRGRSWP